MAKKRVTTPHANVNRTIVRIKLSQLRPHHQQQQIFTDLSKEAVGELAADIERNGLLNPIEITSKYKIIAGHGRVQAVKLLGWAEAPCWVRDDLDDEEANRRHIEDNLHRRQLSQLEFARAYRALRQLGDDSLRNGAAGDIRDIIGQRLGVSGRTLDRLVLVLDAPIEVQQAFESGRLTQKEAVAVARLGEVEQQKVAKAIASGKPPRDVVTSVGKVQPKAPMPKTTLARLVRAMEEADVALRPVLHKFSTLAARHVPGLQIGRQLADDLIRQITGNDRIADAVKQLATKNGAPRR